jgi:hypothetical protein
MRTGRMANGLTAHVRESPDFQLGNGTTSGSDGNRKGSLYIFGDKLEERRSMGLDIERYQAC